MKYIGVTAPANSIPNAYLFYFRHTAQAKDYPDGDGLLTKGVSDYLEGQMQVSRQISAPGKNVETIVPVAVRRFGRI